MTNVIVAFSKPEDAKNVKNILVRSGFTVAAVCTSGAQALNSADELNHGILVCGYRFADMMYGELFECMPRELDMLLVASPNQKSGKIPEGVCCLDLPMKVQDLIDTLEAIAENQERKRKKKRNQPRERSNEEKILIEQAKQKLMESSRMTELEAHRYIQKYSMDSKTSLVETAQMIMGMREGRHEIH